MEQQFYRLRQIIGNPKKGIPAIIPVSRATWYRGMADGRYPRPVKIASKSTAWRAADIRDLVERINNSRNENPEAGLDCA